MQNTVKRYFLSKKESLVIYKQFNPLPNILSSLSKWQGMSDFSLVIRDYIWHLHLVKKDMDINEHEILSNFTFRHKLK
jgi:hypothetical protein